MMSCAMCMEGVICDMDDIVSEYEKLDRFIRFDSACTVSYKSRRDMRRATRNDSSMSVNNKTKMKGK